MRFTPAFLGDDGNILENSLAAIEKFKIGGIDQWVFMRGANKDRPLLIFLHGGPGCPESPLVRDFCPELESLFLVAHWEQRMSGKSYSRRTPRESLTIKQYLEDTIELTETLLAKYGKKKAYILGHSWGSFLGVMAAKARPDLYEAFMGAGQAVYQDEAERLSYDFGLESARAAGDEKSIRLLEKIGRPPYTPENMARSLLLERRVTQKYGGLIHNTKLLRFSAQVIKPFFQSEYTALDKLHWALGQVRLSKDLFPEVTKVDFRLVATRLKIPVYIFQGKYDYTTPTSLVKEYFALLEAPTKELFIFENSSHQPLYEEGPKFIELVKTRVLGKA